MTDDYQGKLIESLLDPAQSPMTLASRIRKATEILNEQVAAPELHQVPTCSKCGSAEIVVDAHARWNPDAQDWVIVRVFEAMGVICESCDAAYSTVVWRMAEDVEVGEDLSDPEAQSWDALDEKVEVTFLDASGRETWSGALRELFAAFPTITEEEKAEMVKHVERYLDEFDGAIAGAPVQIKTDMIPF